MKSTWEYMFYISVCIGMAISSSTFTMISGLSELVSGWGLFAAIVLGGMFCLGIAASVSELASIYPAAPGIRTYLKNAFGEKMSLFFLYQYLLFMIFIGGVECYTFAMVVQYVFPQTPLLLTVFVSIGLIVLTNLRGLDLPRTMQMLSTGILMLGILFLGIVGVLGTPRQPEAFHIDTLTDNYLQIIPAISMAIFFFVGFEWVTPLGINKVAYERKIPRSMPIAILMSLVMYVIFCAGLNYALSPEDIVKDSIPQMKYAALILGQWGIYFGLAISFLAVFSTFNAGVMGGARLVYAIAREGYFPKFASRISLKNGVPYGAIWFLGITVFVICTFVIFTKTELIFAIVGSSIVCTIYSVLMYSLIVIKKKGVKAKSTFKTKVPVAVQYGLILILPMLAILSLLSVEEIIVPCIALFSLVILFSYLWSGYMVRNKGQAAASRTALKTESL